MKLVGYILLACLVIAGLQYAIAAILIAGLLAALVCHPRETIAFAALAILLNALAVHPLPTIAGIFVLLLVALVWR